MTSTFNTAAYGGSGWQARSDSHAEEIGSVWADCGIENEWQRLLAIILHQPGEELRASHRHPDQSLMLQAVDLDKARAEHDRLVQAYRDLGVRVDFVNPQQTPAPNQMFCADLVAMTPEGAILARPASTLRAGEERQMSRCLADLGIPILKTLTGNACFEAADLIWLNRQQAIIGRGLRSNSLAINQIMPLLNDMGSELLAVDLPYGCMHLMGMLRIVDRNLALAWPRRTPHAAVLALRDAGYEVVFLPDLVEFEQRKAFNFVTLGPRRILMVADNPAARAFYESLQIECFETPAGELAKAAGAVGCLTGIVQRQVT